MGVLSDNGRGYGRGYGQRDSGGRNGGRGRNTPEQNNLFIPNHVLEAVGPRYRAMLFRGRDQMEQETNQHQPGTSDISTRNASTTVQSHQISEIT